MIQKPNSDSVVFVRGSDFEIDDFCYHGSCRITAYCFDHSGSLFFITNDQKQLLCFETKSWTIKSQFLVPKRVVSMFMLDKLIIADKHGDCYSFDNEFRLLLGHVSMVTCAVGTQGFIITGDRDEKIRVSKYPQTHEIHTFLLGHKSFISKLALDDVLVSGGGDDFLLVWDYQNGKLLKRIDLRPYVPDINIAVCGLQIKNNKIIVAIEGLKKVLIFQNFEFKNFVEVDEEVCDVFLNQDLYICTKHNIYQNSIFKKSKCRPFSPFVVENLRK